MFQTLLDKELVEFSSLSQSIASILEAKAYTFCIIDGLTSGRLATELNTHLTQPGLFKGSIALTSLSDLYALTACPPSLLNTKNDPLTALSIADFMKTKLSTHVSLAITGSLEPNETKTTSLLSIGISINDLKKSKQLTLQGPQATIFNTLTLTILGFLKLSLTEESKGITTNKRVIVTQ